MLISWGPRGGRSAIGKAVRLVWQPTLRVAAAPGRHIRLWTGKGFATVWQPQPGLALPPVVEEPIFLVGGRRPVAPAKAKRSPRQYELFAEGASYVLALSPVTMTVSRPAAERRAKIRAQDERDLLSGLLD